jgi:hypothetical protein
LHRPAVLNPSLLKDSESVKRVILRLIFALYWLLIFEGALRKWLFPSQANVIFFIRDPIVILIYFLSIKCGLWPKKNKLFSYAMALGCFGAILIAAQALIYDFPLAILVYGWRNYFLYIPLIFIIASVLDRQGLMRLCRHTLLASIPVAFLVYGQFYSPVNSFINRSVVPGVFFGNYGARGSSVIRATGTFTFFHGHQLYVASLVVFLFLAWIFRKSRWSLKGVFLYAATCAVAVIFALDYTRMPMILGVLIVLGVLFSAVFIKDRSLRARLILVPLILLSIEIAVMTKVFTLANHLRWRRIAEAQDTTPRLKRLIMAFIDPLMHVPFYGYGIGLANRAADGMVYQPNRKLNVPVLGCKNVSEILSRYEEEWSRIIIEAGPILGLLYIAFRIWLVLALGLNALRSLRLSQDPPASFFFAFIAVIILFWYINHIGSVHGYAFIFAGFCLAASLNEAPRAKA